MFNVLIIVGRLKFAGLCDSGIQASKCCQFSGIAKFRDITYFADNGCARDTANTGNRSNGGFQFFHDTSDFRFRFLYLFFNKGNLLNQCFELEGEAAFGKSNAKRAGCSGF